MLNPGGLDAGTRGFQAQFGQQQGNAGFSLGNLAGALQAGGMQASQLGVRGGLTGLQGAAGAQQIGQGRFPPQALQPNLQQQLGNYQARQGQTLANAGLANGMAAAAAAAAGIRGGLAMNGQAGLATVRPNNVVDARAAGNVMGAFGLGGGTAAGQQQQQQGATGGLNLQNTYGQQQTASLAAALGSQQAALNMQGIGRLTAAGMAATNLQNAQQRMGAALGNMGILAGPGGMPPPGANPSQDLLAMIGRQKQAPTTTSGSTFGAAPQLGAGSSHHGLLGGQHGSIGGGDQEPGPGPLDETNYPTLGGGQPGLPRPHGSIGGGLGAGSSPADMSGFGGLGIRKAVGPGAAGAAGSGSEFSMAHEDFPALGGGGGQQGLGYGQQQQQAGRGPGGGFLQSGGGGVDGQQQLSEQMSRQSGGAEQYEQLLRYQQQQQQQGRAAAATAGAALRGSPAGTGVQDRHGLLGLMPLLRMTDQDLTMLALGTDLTSLGLNLNSSDSLHKTFTSPLSDTPIRSDPEFDLPACYRHNPQRLQPGYLSKFKEETLFYVFYSMPQDEAQLVAADELYTRGWFWHRRVKLWMIAAPNTASQKTPRGERGSYLVFDPSLWEVVPKPDAEIVYDDLEPHPRLPRAKHLAVQQPQAVGRH